MENELLKNEVSNKSLTVADIEMAKEKRKFILALVLFIIFGIILITGIFKLKEPNDIISLAGIFSAWIGAVISFYYIEHQSSVRVSEAIKSREQVREDLEAERSARKLAEEGIRDLPSLQKEYQNLANRLNEINRENLKLQREVMRSQEAVDQAYDTYMEAPEDGFHIGEVLSEEEE